MQKGDCMGILNGLKILDFTTLLPGPFATMMFADMGADVLRVESPTRVDMVKEMTPQIDGLSATHHQLNRSKQSIALDLKTTGAVELVKKLIQEYDIVIEQFRPGVMEKFGLDYETLKKENPKLIYCSITGYGQTGPYKNRAGHDNNFLAISGMLDYSRRKGERPVPQGVQIADLAGGSMHAVIGILAAALKRTETGKGDYIDISMTDTAFSLNAMFGPAYLAEGTEPKAEQLLLNGGSFYDYYETKDGRYFSVGSLEPPFFKMLCETLEAPELLPLGLATELEEQQQLKQALQQKFQEKDFREWQAIFGEDFNGCVEPVLTFKEATEHPQLQAREAVVEVPTTNGETLQQLAFPIKFQHAKPVYKHTGSKLGVHVENVLKEQGISQAQYEAWQQQGVFGEERRVRR